jgi:hypothetical protein
MDNHLKRFHRTLQTQAANSSERKETPKSIRQGSGSKHHPSVRSDKAPVKHWLPVVPHQGAANVKHRPVATSGCGQACSESADRTPVAEEWGLRL